MDFRLWIVVERQLEDDGGFGVSWSAVMILNDKIQGSVIRTRMATRGGQKTRGPRRGRNTVTEELEEALAHVPFSQARRPVDQKLGFFSPPPPESRVLRSHDFQRL